MLARSEVKCLSKGYLPTYIIPSVGIKVVGTDLGEINQDSLEFNLRDFEHQ